MTSLQKKVVPELFRYKFEREINPGDVKKVADWLDEGQDAFLWAGALFLLSGMGQIASGPLANYDKYFNSPEPFPFDYVVFLMFIAGLAVTAYGVYRTQQVIKFISYPSRIDRIARFGSMFKVSLTRLLTLAFVTVNAIFEALYFVVFIPVWFTPLSETTVTFRILDASLLLGILAMVFLAKYSKSPKLSRKDAIAPTLVMIPYVVIGLLLISSGLLKLP